MVRGECRVRPQRPRPGPTTGGSRVRTCPHRKLRRKVPRVDGALTTQPEHRPSHQRAAHRRRRCSRRLPARKRPASASCPQCSPVPALRRGQGDGRRVPAGRCRARVAGRSRPALATRRGRQRGCGYGRVCSVAASIGCSLFPGGFLFQNHYHIR